MPLHALLKQPYHVLVVWVLLKLQLPAVLHELLELRWVTFAELIQSSFNLLLFDVCILFILTPTWQSLPGQTASEQVKKHMTNSL